jgi:transposase
MSMLRILRHRFGCRKLEKDYFYNMFVRKKKNRSGSTSIVVVNKVSGRVNYLKTIGISSDELEIERLFRQGQEYIHNLGGQKDIFVNYNEQLNEEYLTNHFISKIENVLLNGTQLILNRIYKRIGFDKIDDQILKHLAVARLSQPMSKAATVDYLKSHFEEDVNLSKIYRYLDKLHKTQQDNIQKISIEHTRKILGGKIGLLFYDVTTLYFETERSDELRENGFSKDGKHSQPQIVLGLLVSKDGYPLSYSIFNGSQYEGRTMIPIVEDFVQRFNLEGFVVVADSGLMNKSNISLLESGGYKYIIGARIKNEAHEIKQWILSLEKHDGEFNERKKGDIRLIIGYSENRAKKDKYNREKGIKRLQQAYKSGNITKENINKKGYNKFLDISDNVKVRINQEKIEQDKKWDGLKGYITNTSLSTKQVYEQYNGLWVIERAYRITKGNIEMRPMFHFNPRRIEAHVCICFVAYKMYKELERVLKISGINLSVDKVLGIAKTITTIKIKLPIQNKTVAKTLLLTKQHKLIEKLFSEEYWQNILEF